MEQKIPTAAEIRGRLALIGHAQTQELAKISGVPFTTLWKIRNGVTENPRIETVGQFFHLIESVKGIDPILETQLTEAAKAGLIERRTAKQERREVNRVKDAKLAAFEAAGQGQGV